MILNCFVNGMEIDTPSTLAAVFRLIRHGLHHSEWHRRPCIHELCNMSAGKVVNSKTCGLRGGEIAGEHD